MISTFPPLGNLAQKRTELLIIAGVSAALFALYVYSALISPRPYYILEHDGEPDYYYNSRLIAFGLPVEGIHHPGTPIYYLGALVLELAGTSLDRTQTFFKYSHFVIFLLRAAGLAAFVFIALRRIPIGVSLLVVASVVAWPSFFVYSQYFGPEAFVAAAGLPALAIFWDALHAARPPDNRRLFIAGVGLGLCLAIKLSFLPVALAMLIASWVHLRGADIGGRGLAQRYLPFVLLPLGALASFLVSTAPIFGRLANVPVHFADHGNLQDLSLSGFGKAVYWFSQASLPYFVVLAAATVLIAYLLIRYLYKGMADGSRDHIAPRPDVRRLDYTAAGVFVLLMLLGVSYVMAKGEVWGSVPAANVGGWLTRDSNPGVVLRQVAPSALGIPFLLLYGYRLARARWPSVDFEAPYFQAALSLVGLAMIGWSLVSYIGHRQDLIERDSQNVTATVEEISGLAAPGTRAAIGGLDYGGSIGEASFHLWGNYRHANGAFDRAVLASYPRYSHLVRFDDVQRVLEERAGDAQALPEVGDEAGSTRGLVSFLREWLLGKVSSPWASSSSDIVTGESHGVNVSLIGFPAHHTDYLMKPDGKVGEAELLALLQSRFGTASMWRQSVAGADWVFISVSPDVHPPLLSELGHEVGR